MNRRRIYNVVGCCIALVAFVNVANAQSRDRANPTMLTSTELSGPIDSDTKSDLTTLGHSCDLQFSRRV